MKHAEIVAMGSDGKFRESYYCQIGNHTYLLIEGSTEPIVRTGSPLYTAEQMFDEFILRAASHNNVDIKPFID